MRQVGGGGVLELQLELARQFLPLHTFDEDVARCHDSISNANDSVSRQKTSGTLTVFSLISK
jgi:hypothetical protein